VYARSTSLIGAAVPTGTVVLSSVAVLLSVGIATFGCRGDEPPPRLQHHRHGPARVAAAAADRLTSTPQTRNDPSMAQLVGGELEVVDHVGATARVKVAPFAIDRTEVTVGAFVRCINKGGCRPKARSMGSGCNLLQPSRFGHPVNCVDREDAAAYCQWAGKRLPTSAEWQFAAAGAEGRRYPWGAMPPESGQLCWKSGSTCAVERDERPTTPDGVADLAGNVWELSDRLCAVHTPRPGLCANFTALVHGGGFNTCEDEQRSCYEMGRTTQLARFDAVPAAAVGFRCAVGGDDASG
jgi:formylglycine-generating enzyme required for sulfatase activity